MWFEKWPHSKACLSVKGRGRTRKPGFEALPGFPQPDLPGNVSQNFWFLPSFLIFDLLLCHHQKPHSDHRVHQHPHSPLAHGPKALSLGTIIYSSSPWEGGDCFHAWCSKSSGVGKGKDFGSGRLKTLKTEHCAEFPSKILALIANYLRYSVLLSSLPSNSKDLRLKSNTESELSSIINLIIIKYFLSGVGNLRSEERWRQGRPWGRDQKLSTNKRAFAKPDLLWTL